MEEDNSYSLKKRLDKLTNFDIIRKIKLLELFQYNFFGFILVTFFGYILDRFIFKKTFEYLQKKHNNKQHKSRVDFFILFIITMLETFLIIVVLFYLRKVLLLIPPIGNKINKNFKTLTTFENVISVTLSFLLVQISTGYTNKISLIMNYEKDFLENHK